MQPPSPGAWSLPCLCLQSPLGGQALGKTINAAVSGALPAHLFSGLRDGLGTSLELFAVPLLLASPVDLLFGGLGHMDVVGVCILHEALLHCLPASSSTSVTNIE